MPVRLSLNTYSVLDLRDNPAGKPQLGLTHFSIITLSETSSALILPISTSV
jgi:hypothetical protein